jgi:hypothetical protein
LNSIIFIHFYFFYYKHKLFWIVSLTVMKIHSLLLKIIVNPFTFQNSPFGLCTNKWVWDPRYDMEKQERTLRIWYKGQCQVWQKSQINMKRFNKYANTINTTTSCLRFNHGFLRLKSNMLLNTRMKYCPMSKFWQQEDIQLNDLY